MALLILKALYGSLLTQVLSIGPTKVSVLFFYRRIFSKNGTRWFNITSLIMIYIVVGWTISFFFVNLFECGLDIDQLWMMKPTASRQCVRQFKMCQSQAYSAVATDILIIILPIPISKLPRLLKYQFWPKDSLEIVMGFEKKDGAELCFSSWRTVSLLQIWVSSLLSNAFRTTAASIARAIVQNGVVKRREYGDSLRSSTTEINRWTSWWRVAVYEAQMKFEHLQY